MSTNLPDISTTPNKHMFKDVSRQSERTLSGCYVLPSQNSSLPLALNWENIPETIVLNGTIGLVLFICFLIMTHIAWKRSYYNRSENSFKTEGLLTFLYGYRDPDKWYVIPRYEFLRHSNRHHRHDMNYPNLYVPPKLPLASPFEILGTNISEVNEDSLDREGRASRQNTFVNLTSKMTNQPTKSAGFKSLKSAADVVPTKQQSETTAKSAKSSRSEKISSPGRSPSETSTLNGAASKSLGNKGGLNPLDPSFFYPSILTAEQLQASYISRILNRFFSLFFQVTDSQLIYAKGIDAYEYLLFQRHLILIMLITNVICLGVILPIHLITPTYDTMTSLNSTSSLTFQQTTIKNMRPDSVYFWAHIVSSVFIVIVAIFVLNSYRSSVIDKDDLQISRRTLLVGNIPKPQRNRAKLSQIFKDNFQGSKLEAIQFVYDISGLDRLQMQLDATTVAKEYCKYLKQKHNREVWVKPSDVNESQTCDGNCRLCSFFYVCCCAWPKETKLPGTIYYPEKEKYYRDRIKSNLENLLKNPSEYAFVTFKSNRQARRFMERLSLLKANAVHHDNADHQHLDLEANEKKQAEFLVSNATGTSDPLDPLNNPYIRSIRSPKASETVNPEKSSGQQATKAVGAIKSLKVPDSSTGSEVKKRKLNSPVGWSVRYAPFPDNVEYYDLLNMNKIGQLTIASLHILIMIIFIFFTTPNVLLSIMERWTILNPEQATKLTGYRGMFINYLSTLLQVITTALLPYFIVLISKQIPFEDAASKTHSTMWKVYLFLILMVIVMPSIGMNSAQAILSSQINIKCWFPTDNGAYFINYVISSIFLSTVLELIKPVDILSYCFILWTGRSSADYEGGRQYIEREFSVSMQHTNVLLLFSVVMTYCISCPLIAPAGLVYLVVKHSVDHYQLYHTYFTKKVDKNMQNTIEIFVRVAMLLMLFQTFLAIYSTTSLSIYSTTSQIIFWISFIISVFGCYSHYSTKAISSTKRSRFVREFCACFYLPRVFDDLISAKAIPNEYISRKV